MKNTLRHNECEGQPSCDTHTLDKESSPRVERCQQLPWPCRRTGTIWARFIKAPTKTGVRRPSPNACSARLSQGNQYRQFLAYVHSYHLALTIGACTNLTPCAVLTRRKYAIAIATTLRDALFGNAQPSLAYCSWKKGHRLKEMVDPTWRIGVNKSNSQCGFFLNLLLLPDCLLPGLPTFTSGQLRHLWEQ